MKRIFRNISKKTLAITAIGFIVLGSLATLLIISREDTSDTLVSVQRGTIVQEVSASGKVESPTTINLRFKSSGTLVFLDTAVGATVTSGQLLATQDTAQLDAQVREMQAGIDLQKAKLAQLIAGTSDEETSVSQTALANAKRDYENVKVAQDILVENAYRTMLNSTIEAVPVDGTSNYIAPTISGNYTLGKEGAVNIFPYNSNSSGGTSFRVTGLVNDTGTSDEVIPQPIGDSGLYIMFPNTIGLSSTDWVIQIPNKDASDYIQNYNAYQLALQTRQSTLASAQAFVDLKSADLAVKEAPTRSTDIAVYQAQISQAEAALQKIYAQRNDLILTAPTSSTVTAVNGERGETVGPDMTIVSLATGGALQIDLSVVEDKIVDVKVGQKARITFDAIKNQEFVGTVVAIDPAETIVGGAVYYKTTVLFDDVDERIRSGMTANVWILTATASDTLFVPASAIQIKDDKMTVQVQGESEMIEKEVAIGIENSTGMIEIISGLSEGEQVILNVQAQKK